MATKFAKYEGIGNDFIIIEKGAPGVAEMSAELAIRMCDRFRGIGGDGVLETGVKNGVPFMTVWNSDGSNPEMCGNGIRCVARYLVDRGLVKTQRFDMQTAAGPHRCVVSGDDVEVSMRVPSFVPHEVPVATDQPMIDTDWTFDGRTLSVTALSLGNPHVVTFDDVSAEDRAKLGPFIEHDPRFPRRVNVGFAQMKSPTEIELNVWERGAGFTQACGTGACAAAVAAVETGRARRNAALKVTLPGGTLNVIVGGPNDPVRMQGPAVHVFDGVYGG